MNKLHAIYQAVLGLLEKARVRVEPLLSKVFGPLELPPGSLLSSIRKSRVRVFPTREALLTRTAPSSLK